MKRYLASVLVLVAAGCASGPPFIDQMQPTATAKGEVVNREQLQPFAFGGPVRAQYTIGVAGCGKRTIVVVLCSENGNQCVERGATG
jgi:hypothetical protein